MLAPKKFSFAVLILSVGLISCGGRSDADDDASTPGDIDAAAPLGCQGPGDCADFEICVATECIPASCEDSEITGNESDVDCGGDCQPCSEGQLCAQASDCMTLFCDSSAASAVCRDCNTLEDCAGADDSYCSSGLCVPRLENGVACTAASECSSGNCVDGVCCDTPCDGNCETCGTGACSAVPAGDDPDNDCEDEGSCGQTGACDGAGGCALEESGVACPTESCAGGGLGTCNGDGVCNGGAGDCNPYTCNNNTACFTDCPTAGNSSRCASGNYCNGSSCVSKRATGNSCSQGYECATGNCVDGFCCNSACNTGCRACAASISGGANGTCTNIPPGEGQQPADCSQQSASTCGRTGLCSGGACQLYGNGTSCAGQTCFGATLTPAKTCNGSGSCTGASSSACPGFLRCANSTSCRTSCSQDSHCQHGYYCSGSSCIPGAGNGTSCTSDSQCGSGNCKNGICCIASCTSPCRTCNSGGNSCGALQCNGLMCCGGFEGCTTQCF